MALLQQLTRLVLLSLQVDSKNNNKSSAVVPWTVRTLRPGKPTFEQRSILVMTIIIVSFNAWAFEGQF